MYAGGFVKVMPEALAALARHALAYSKDSSASEKILTPLKETLISVTTGLRPACRTSPIKTFG